MFLIAGIIACAASLFLENDILSALLAVLGFTLFWSIKELFEQEERVQKGWYPANPKRAGKDAQPPLEADEADSQGADK